MKTKETFYVVLLALRWLRSKQNLGFIPNSLTYPRCHSHAAAAVSGGFWSAVAAGSFAAPAELHAASAARMTGLAAAGASGRPAGTVPRPGAAPREPSGGAGSSPEPPTGPGPDRAVRTPVKSCCLPATDDVRPQDLPPPLRTLYMVRCGAREACADQRSNEERRESDGQGETFRGQ